MKSNIPKYLRKRKVELVRKKIITRKYGYLFYRKTISEILPSQAQKFYLKHLLIRCFSRWYSYCYENTIGWKYQIRAEIHYSLNLKQKYFKQWKVYFTMKKAYLIKRQVAIFYHQKHFETLTIRIYFRKWQYFVKQVQFNKECSILAWNFYKSKNYPGILRRYMYKWRILVKVMKKKNELLQQSRRIYQTKLKRKCFRAIVLNKIHHKQKKAKYKELFQFYCKKLKCIAFVRWKNYLRTRQKTKENFILADICYSVQLKTKYLGLLKIYTLRRKYIRNKLKEIDIILMRKSLTKWLIYKARRKDKKLTRDYAIEFSNSKLKSAVLYQFKCYVQYRNAKKTYITTKTNCLIMIMRLNKLKYSFQKWMAYKIYKTERHHLNITVFRYNRQKLMRIVLVKLKLFLTYQKRKHDLFHNSVLIFNNSLLKKCFNAIKSNWIERIRFKKDIFAAEIFYRNSLIEEVLRTIVISGIKKKEHLLDIKTTHYRRKIVLLQKYTSIWKQKTIYKRTFSKQAAVNADETNEWISTDTNWFQMCFIAPKTL